MFKVSLQIFTRQKTYTISCRKVLNRNRKKKKSKTRLILKFSARDGVYKEDIKNNMASFED